MNPRSGLTLVEVLAALVLLTLVGTTTLGFVRRAREALGQAPSAVTAFELGAIADALLADPVQFGLERIPEEGEVPWPNRRDLPKLQLKLVRAQDPAIERAWLAVTCDRTQVLRCVSDPPDLSAETER